MFSSPTAAKNAGDTKAENDVTGAKQ